jgi:hypothetical protein
MIAAMNTQASSGLDQKGREGKMGRNKYNGRKKKGIEMKESGRR